MNWSEFLHMGGYAFYVWASYGLMAALLLLNLLLPVKKHADVIDKIRQRLAQNGNRP